MYLQLSRIGACEVNQHRKPKQFSGSSSYTCVLNDIRKKPLNINNEEIKKDSVIKAKTIEKKPKTKSYGLKKSKIRNKILSFFSLNASKKFCAFYSISFPIEITDEIGYKVLNTWLTRCRKELGLKSYLWVAERQKNGTLHFHLITNNYMPIRKTNEMMKIALFNQWEKGLINCKEKSIINYNGIDVDNLYHSKREKNKGKRLEKIESQRKLSMYLTKYISKNNTKSNRLPWHCSRDISALFTSINYTDVSNLEIVQLIRDNPEAVFTFKEEYFTMHFFKFIPNEWYFKDLVEANNLIFETLNPN